MYKFLNIKQVEKISDVLLVMGEIIFASAVIPGILGISNLESSVVPSGIMITPACWFNSVIILKGID